MPPPQHRKRRRPPVHNPPKKNAPAAKTGPAARPPDPPPVRADVWRWFRTGVLDGFIFLLAALASSVIQMRTGFQWMMIFGVVIAVILTNWRRLPARHKAVKAGYFGGLASLFTVGMLAMLFIMPRAAQGAVMLYSAGMAVICVVSLTIGLRAVPTNNEPETDGGP